MNYSQSVATKCRAAQETGYLQGDQMESFRGFLRDLPFRIRDRVAMQPAVQRALLPFGRELAPDRWIFIIGCYNSGTTLLANILRQHPLIGGLPTEGVYLSDVLPYPEKYGWPRNWAQCVDRVRLDPERDAHLADRIRRQWSIWAPTGRPNIVEKSIANAARMPFLAAHFRPARFIYIVRNGYAVSAGIHRKANVSRWGGPYQGQRYPMELCARQWRVSDETVAADSLKIPHVLQIYYEDLVARPGEVLQGITEFLGIPSLAPEIVTRSWHVHGVVEPIRDMNEDVLGGLTDPEIEAIEKEAGARLAAHGYMTPRATTGHLETESGMCQTG